MNIPAQVKAQGDRADELLKGSDNPENIEKKEGEKPEDQAHNQPAAEAETVESLKHKLSVLQGKYNSEIQPLKNDVTLLSTLKNQVRQLNGQLNEANLLIADLQKQITEKSKADLQAEQSGKLSDEDREYLKGEGFDNPDRLFEIFGKVQKERSQQVEQGKVADTVEQIKQEVRQEREERFWSELNKGIQDAEGKPDWRAVNDSDAFTDWLDIMLPYSQQTRRDALKAAQAALDYGTVIKIFNDFKATLPPNKENNHFAPTPESQIEPDTSLARIERPEGETKGKIYTRKEVKDFYKEWGTGVYRGREDEAKKIDADILRAQQEGRIRD